jgi:hypothetical protein
MKKVLMFLALFISAALVLIFTTASSNGSKVQQPAVKAPEEGFALIELFTSQGCSSCPPADRVLGQYAAGNNENVIAIAFHVDYWDRLGWRDPFSQALFSDRQRHYASSFGGETVYTPQAVVNGSSELVGSDASKLALAVTKAIAQQPRAFITIGNVEKLGRKLSFSYTVSGIYNGTVINAALVQRQAATAIRTGENGGLQLTNYNVVRDFTSSNAEQSGHATLTIPDDAATAAFNIVLYLQQDGNGKIVAASQKAVW